MSLRPRFAGDGRLRLPQVVTPLRDHVSIPDGGTMLTGHLGETLTDPFGRGADGLLLAESFARLDTDEPRALAAWMTQHGVLDSGRTIVDQARPRRGVRALPYFEDPVP